ncbi:C39 family peptidase [Sediminispirochaeta bajacaliforniensis]|uniref:C39 family peptidase n=1 Tax=Sediminispirochaeta bajacaliforniensis TaxID=148 RepID=UPI00036BD376|nr:C39 family peptidase [Sediminispirochaeta bajacaliforniensis]
MRKSITIFSLLSLLLVLLAQGLSAEGLSIDVPSYTQGKEAPWADEKLGIDSWVTIRSHGCALTCIAMVVSYFTGEENNPSVMNRWLQTHDGFEVDRDIVGNVGQAVLNWPALTAYGDGWVYTRFDWKALPADIILTRYYLDHGIPVIAEVVYKGAPHYVVLTGYDEKGFIMNDPELPDEHSFGEVYNISDTWGSGAARNLYGIRVLYPRSLTE